LAIETRRIRFGHVRVCDREEPSAISSGRFSIPSFASWLANLSSARSTRSISSETGPLAANAAEVQVTSVIVSEWAADLP